MFDLAALAQQVSKGPVARVVIGDVKGSSPRELGASMLVWEQGQSGSIGGGALEWLAVVRARAILAQGGRRFDREALGPDLGQCCGGVVSLLTEVYTAKTLPPGPVVARSLMADSVAAPLAVARVLAAARGHGGLQVTQVVQGWLLEPVSVAQRQVWIWGAGHVGRALVAVLGPLPQLGLTWVDITEDRFPQTPTPVRILPVANPEHAVALAPADAEHLIFTYSHALDLALCHRILKQDFKSCGLIGSASKWARFRSRLGGLGHSAQAISRIQCPIGDPSLGKHPQAIAIGVATELLRSSPLSQMMRIT